MNRIPKIIYLMTFCVVLANFFSGAQAAPAPKETVETKDSNGDGKTDTWITRDGQRRVTMIATDGKHKDGKPHHWVYYKNGAVTKREWDRNFDGNADLRIYENRGLVLKKEYDDNFDGKFGRVEKPLPKGSSGKIRTTNDQNPAQYQ